MFSQRVTQACLGLAMTVMLSGRALAVDPPVLSNPRRVGGTFEFTLLGQSNSSYRIETTLNFQGWTVLTTNTDASATRVISLPAPAARAMYRVARLGSPYFRYALASAETVDLNGQNLNVDSFNSANPLYSTNGAYTSVKRRDAGDTAAVRGVTNPPAVGNAVINGVLRTGPGGAVQIGPMGSVGSLNWTAVNAGIQPGWSTTNLNLSLPAVAPPFQVGFTPASGFVGTEFYDYVLNTGNYTLAALGLSTGQRMYVGGQASLYVSGGVTIAGNASLVIATNASLRLFVGGANASLSMAAVAGVRRAVQFQIYGLAGNTSVNVLGGPSMAGAIYAPSAILTLGTGGAGTAQFSGALAARAIRLSGSFAVHFDEDLAAFGPAY